MKISSYARYVFSAAAGAAMLAACSSNGSSLAPSAGAPPANGQSTQMPGAGRIGRALTINGLLVTAAHPGNVNQQGGVSPDRHRKHKKAPEQYISNFNDSTVLQFDYPKSDASIGSIANVSDSQGECTRTGKGTFWVTASGSDEVEEFKYNGTTPIATLSESDGEPAGCAIDASTGDLATTILSNGDIIVYKGASGSGKVYTTPLVEAFFPGYDGGGNLFADGFNSGGAFQLVELKKGSSSFESVSTSNSVLFPGNVQWDGTYVTVNDQEAHAIYQYSVSGTTATLKGTVALNGSSDCDQTWIANGKVFCPDAGNEEGLVYKYPAGGSAIATLTGSFDLPIGAVQVLK